MNLDQDDDEVRRAIVLLVENLLRIVAGAGKVQYLERQLDRLNKALAACNDADKLDRGWNHIDDIIDDELDLWSKWPKHDEAYANYDIVQHALRLAAARLVRDNSHASRSDGNLEHAIRQHRVAAEALR